MTKGDDQVWHANRTSQGENPGMHYQPAQHVHINVLRDGEPTVLSVRSSVYERVLDILRSGQRELEERKRLETSRLEAIAKFKRSKLWVNTQRTNILTHPWLVPTGYRARFSALMRTTT